MELILASTSPRRHELLAKLEVPFEAVTPLADETIHNGESPERAAERIAREKVHGIASQFPHAAILGSDTLVVNEGRIYGKPSSPEEAIEMLRELEGRPHQVITSVAIYVPSTGFEAAQVEVARVTMGCLSEKTIKRYVATGEPLDKAGSYAVQGEGGKFIKSVDGDYFGVVGLPLRATAKLLKRAGIPIAVEVEALYEGSNNNF